MTSIMKRRLLLFFCCLFGKYILWYERLASDCKRRWRVHPSGSRWGVNRESIGLGSENPAPIVFPVCLWAGNQCLQT